MARIELDQICLTFRVWPASRTSFKDFLLGPLVGRSRQAPPRVDALRDISLQITDGDRLGIIGPNGAGKSTLLKVLAGIYPPTRGCRMVEGRISSLFDLSVGFEPEATGWDNIAYRCYLQGETPASVRAKKPEIAEFSELGSFLDLPVRCYSAGMLLRLAFSIATAVEPDILLIDEVLTVGDQAFQQKARQRMRDLMEQARLIVLVSHDLQSLADFCTRAIWLENGGIRKAGPARQVTAAYAARGAGEEECPVLHSRQQLRTG